jgi:hypothetical protein
VADQEEEEEEDISMEHDDRSSGQDRGIEIFFIKYIIIYKERVLVQRLYF